MSCIISRNLAQGSDVGGSCIRKNNAGTDAFLYNGDYILIPCRTKETVSFSCELSKEIQVKAIERPYLILLVFHRAS